jgi:hypothetical protein
VATTTDPASLEELVGRLQALAPELIVLEATDGREGPAVAALAAVRLLAVPPAQHYAR